MACIVYGFLPIIIYKVLKHYCKGEVFFSCFLPIIIYKVLKLISVKSWIVPVKKNRFLPIIIYKVLKHEVKPLMPSGEFLTHHNLQGSQTTISQLAPCLSFLTHHNLQGSQTFFFPQFQLVTVSYPS